MTGWDPGGPIVIAGGYGGVGRLLAQRLAPAFPRRVLVAGRDPAKARAVAAQVGYGASSAALDVVAPSTFAVLLESAAMVISCVALTNVGFARACLTAGVHYVDITADAGRIAAVERLDRVAVDAGAVGVLSVGLAPGLTNLLAHNVCSLLEKVDQLDLGVQLSVADVHGPAALAWTLDNLTAPYTAIRNGAAEPATPFGRHCTLDFGAARAAPASSFNFPEQRTLARTLNVPTVSSWLALQPRAVHVAGAASVRLGLAGLLRSPRAHAALLSGLSRLPARPARCAVSARATGVHHGRVLRVGTSIAGYGEADLTAQVAVHVARHVLAHPEQPGVHHIEQLTHPERLLAELSEALRPAPLTRTF